MTTAFQIFKKELLTYFVSPIAYIVIAIFLVVTGWFFFATFFLFDQASMRNFFDLLPGVFAFIIPAVTMKLFAEELNAGSYEILMTLPVSMKEVITGKFLAAVAFVAFMLLPTAAYPLCISLIGNLDWGPVLGGYIGAILLGGAFCAVGVLASALTRSQIIAFIIAMTICFTLVIIDKMLFFMPPAVLNFFQYIGADYHFRNISKGVIDSRDLVYFASVIFLGLYGTYMTLSERN